MWSSHMHCGNQTRDIGGNTYTGKEIRKFSSHTFRAAFCSDKLEQGSSEWHKVQIVSSHSLVMSKLVRKALVCVSVRMSNPSFVAV